VRVPTGTTVDADVLLDLVRPLVAVVDGVGTIVAARGGAGGFLGHRTDELVGRNVLDLVPSHEHGELVQYFADLVGVPLATTELPVPFRSVVLGADGREHRIDVIPTAIPAEVGVNGWAVVLVPLSLQAGASRSLDAELAGASQATVKQLLTEELAHDGTEWSARWFLVDLGAAGPVAAVGPATGDFGLVDEVRTAFERGWQPWAEGASFEHNLASSALPDPLAAAVRSGGHDIVNVASITCDGMVVAALVRVGRSTSGAAEVAFRVNVLSRIRSLIETTTLLYGRWRERERLVTAATTDPLTGVANRDAFTDALGERADRSAVAYVDIDRFKDVNDVFGHAVGDQVLSVVAHRLVDACRATDVVARLGGDEFVVLVDTVDRWTAHRVGQRILDAVAAPLAIPGGPPHVSVSIGIALPSGGSDPVELADRAMLAAKRRGRSRLVMA
jgi:diguanylate cyclase (GGDEF)-like protein